VSLDFLAVVDAKRFLGREFLTWLVHRAEETGGRFDYDGDVVEIALGDRVVLEGEVGRGERLTLTGEGDVRLEMGAGLRRGKLLDRAKLSIRRGEQRWELVLDGGLLAYGSVRCPPLGDRDVAAHGDPRAQLENDLFLRMADVEAVVDVIDTLFAEFCRLRASDSWRRQVLPTLRGWAAGLA
jgi:hypothetical protein